jgi:AcrR family transcriptional regulator
MTSTRDAIARAADRLFYEKGYEATSFGDIAAAVGISRGNFYYHFRSKDEILEAVIDLRLESTAEMLSRWEDESGGPAGRIGCFIDIMVSNRAQIVLHGCPVGTLCTELAKLDHVARDRASGVFSLFRGWLGRQFGALGHGAAADVLAMHVLSRSQGAATLAAAFRDEAFLRREVDDLHDWLAGLCPRAA